MTQPTLGLIVGCQRSGTNLLASLLDRGTDCAVTTDDPVAARFARLLPLAGDLTDAGARCALVGAIYAYLYAWELRDRQGAGLPPTARFGLLATAARRAEIADGARSFEAILYGMYGAYARLRDRAWAVGKCAFRAPLPFEALDEAVPTLRLVHIIRDGRDVAASWQRTYFGPVGIANAGRAWSTSVQACRAWGRANTGRYHEVRYEHLVTSPNEVIDGVAAFLGCARTPDRGAGAREQSIARVPWLTDLASLPRGDKVGAWRGQLSKANVSAFAAVAGPTLADLGYANSSGAAGMPAVRDTKALLAPITWRRAAAETLPRLLLVSARWHLPIHAVLLRRLDRALNAL